ncbi:MAG: glycosyltransferase [Winogradskyella sp.]|uniref:glycosyl transferase family 1 n=1 Tax=Winogradskyella sp. TaxID=1883156 RepID=UPI0017C21DCC|nr:glycosyl transferase family 1 [Winogradskyella sp.]MBT8244785.1 glycosyltransferase [Winogradskyella sp.]NNK22911.1 glycosyltransferase [Winogradskyella sp.]
MDGKKKVLIITYYWPPAGGPGVQRWLKFVKYLPEYDIEPIVYCPLDPNYPIVDESLLDELPEHIKVIKQPISEPYRFAKLLSKKSSKAISTGVIPKKEKQSLIERLLLYVRGNFFIPDARKSWVKPSVKFLLDYIKKNDIETVITTGPPHSLHLIGLNLKQNIGLNWIADFRDPWTTIGYHKALKLRKSAKQKHLQLESDVLTNADQIIVTSNHTKKEFLTKTDKPIDVITNGYDSHSVIVEKKDSDFTISHIGSLLSERNPTILWEVLSELVKEDEAFASKLKLNLIGVVSDAIIRSISSYGLVNHLNTPGYVNHYEAIAFQKKSQLLLLIEIDSEDTKAIIPGKLFEYMISETPIVAFGPENSDVEGIIKKTNTGTYFRYSDKFILKEHIKEAFNTYKAGALKTHPIGLQQYSRQSLTECLAKLVKNV